MTQPGYNAGSESVWWWKVAMHLDAALLTLAKATAHNVDDPRPLHALGERLREGQAILLEIFRAKGLLKSEMPTPTPGMMPGMTISTPAVPEAMVAAIEAADAAAADAAAQAAAGADAAAQPHSPGGETAGSRPARQQAPVPLDDEGVTTPPPEAAVSEAAVSALPPTDPTDPLPPFAADPSAGGAGA